MYNVCEHAELILGLNNSAVNILKLYLLFSSVNMLSPHRRLIKRLPAWYEFILWHTWVVFLPLLKKQSNWGSSCRLYWPAKSNRWELMKCQIAEKTTRCHFRATVNCCAFFPFLFKNSCCLSLVVWLSCSHSYSLSYIYILNCSFHVTVIINISILIKFAVKATGCAVLLWHII